MSDAEFIDDRGEAGPEDNAEWLRWAAETYASAVENGGCYSPEPDWDFEAISPRLREAAAEIERLRARVAVLEQALGLLTTLAPKMEIDTSDPLGMARNIEATVRAALEATQ